MITTEILSQSNTQFTLSIKVDNQEFYGRPLEFSRIPYLTIEQQIQNIIYTIPVTQNTP
jgi:hypothetical protein